MITSVFDDLEKREPWCTVSGNVNWYSHSVKQYGGSSKNAKIEHDLAIPPMGTYPKEMDYYLKEISIPP